MKNRIVFIQLISDAIIPILGFFLWDWSLYFIALFYFLDLLVNEALVHLKTKKIKSYSEKITQKDWLNLGLKSIALLLGVIIIIHLAFIFIQPGIQFTAEAWSFLSYEEMGIQQGLILIPLVFMMGYARFQNEFIRPKLFMILEPQAIWKSHLQALVLLVVFALVCLLVASCIFLPEWVYLIAIIVLTSAFQLVKHYQETR